MALDINKMIIANLGEDSNLGDSLQNIFQELGVTNVAVGTGKSTSSRIKQIKSAEDISDLYKEGDNAEFRIKTYISLKNKNKNIGSPEMYTTPKNIEYAEKDGTRAEVPMEFNCTPKFVQWFIKKAIEYNIEINDQTGFNKTLSMFLHQKSPILEGFIVLESESNSGDMVYNLSHTEAAEVNISVDEVSEDEVTAFFGGNVKTNRKPEPSSSSRSSYKSSSNPVDQVLAYFEDMNLSPRLLREIKGINWTEESAATFESDAHYYVGAVEKDSKKGVEAIVEDFK